MNFFVIPVTFGVFLFTRAVTLAVWRGEFIEAGYTFLASLFFLSFFFEELWGDWVDLPIFGKRKSKDEAGGDTSASGPGTTIPATEPKKDTNGGDMMKKILTKPGCYAAMLFGGIATMLFVGAYLANSWKLFHLAFIATLASLTSATLCKEEWRVWTANNYQKYWKEIWLAVSVTSAALVFGHGWSTVAMISSLVSTTFAAITVANGWGKTREIIMKIFSGGYGKDVTCLALSVLCYSVFWFMITRSNSYSSYGAYLDRIKPRMSPVAVASTYGLATASILLFIASTFFFKRRFIKDKDSIK